MTSAVPYWRLSSFYFFYFSLLGATAPFLALYFHHLGFPSPRIGELVAIPMLMRCVAPNLWGWLGDRSGQRLAIVRFGAVCTALGFSLIFVSHSYAWLALVMALHAFFWHAVLPQFEVITLAHLRERSASYSRIRLWGSIGFICTVVGLGALFERLSLDVYPATLLGIMLGIVLCSWWVPNAQPAHREPREGEGGFLAQLRQPGVLAFYLCVCLMQLSHGPYYTFLTLHLESLGYSRALIGLLWALGVVAEVMLFLAMPRLLQRFSLRQVLAASFLLASLRWLLLGNLADSLALLVLPRRCMPPPSAVFMRLPSISCSVASARASRVRARPCMLRWPVPAEPWARCIPAIAGTAWALPGPSPSPAWQPCWQPLSSVPVCKRCGHERQP